MYKLKVIINIGISGAGKTTWSINYIKKHPKTVRINRDDLRKTIKGTLDGYYQSKLLNPTEDLVNKLEESILAQAIVKDFDVIIDNTNLKPAYITRWLDIIESFNEGDFYKIEVLFKIFPEDHAMTLKQRVNVRDAPQGWDKLDYIDKQVASLAFIKRYIEVNHKNQIISE